MVMPTGSEEDLQGRGDKKMFAKTHKNNRMRIAIYEIMRDRPGYEWRAVEVREALFDHSNWCRRALGSTQQVVGIMLRAPGVERLYIARNNTKWRLFDEFK